MTEKENVELLMEAVSDLERDNAQNAYNDFKKRNYTACQQFLNKFDRTNDFKLAHNKALVEYYKSDLKKTDNFQKHLTSISNQFKIKFDKLDDVDYCVLHYNQAVLHYHQRQYTQAIRIIDKVYKFIDSMDESLAKQVSLLAIELQLCIRQPVKALSLFNYLENQLLPPIGNNNNTNKITTEKVTASKEKNDKKTLQLPEPPGIEEFRRKLRKYKIRCLLMKHSLSAVTSELQILAKEKGNVDGMFLAANLEYLKGNPHEAIKILTSIPPDSYTYSEHGESFAVLFNNNMGILHHKIGKPNLACYYYQQALKDDIAFCTKTNNDTSDKPLHTLGFSRYHELMYNLGISLLYSGKATQAFDCLIIAVRRYHRNSRLWLRLAECCIVSHKESNEVDFDLPLKQKEMVTGYVGSKETRKAILGTNLSKDQKYSSESQSYAVPVPSLEFASLCLRNALLLLPTDTANAPVPLFLIPGVTPPAPPPSPGPAPSAPLSPDCIAALKNAVLCNSAYVALCLGDYILSLEHAKELLAQSKLSGVHKLLGSLYAGESLVLLEKLSEALTYLKPENVKDIEFDFNPSASEELSVKTKPPKKWFPNTLASAHAVLQYNIAVVKTIRGELDQAETLLKQIWQTRSSTSKVPAHIIMLVIYIELQLGHAEVARNLIKQYSYQHRLSG